jgi:hypothetical protein
MSDILADYREWRDAQPVRVSTHSAGCHMWHRDCMIHRLADALGRARLTDAEREAIDAGADALESLAGNDNDGRIRAALMIAANTLRGFLKRTG